MSHLYLFIFATCFCNHEQYIIFSLFKTHVPVLTLVIFKKKNFFFQENLNGEF